MQTGTGAEVGRTIDGRTVTYEETTGLFFVGDQRHRPEAVRRFWLAGELVWANARIETWFESSFPPTMTSAVYDRLGKRIVVATAVAVAVFVCGPCAVLMGVVGRSANWWFFVLLGIALVGAVLLQTATAPTRPWLRLTSAVAFWCSLTVFTLPLALLLSGSMAMILAGLGFTGEGLPASSVSLVLLAALLYFDSIFALFGWLGGRLQAKWDLPLTAVLIADLTVVLLVWLAYVVWVARLNTLGSNDPIVVYVQRSLATPLGPFVALMLGSWLGLRSGPFIHT